MIHVVVRPDSYFYAGKVYITNDKFVMVTLPEALNTKTKFYLKNQHLVSGRIEGYAILKTGIHKKYEIFEPEISVWALKSIPRLFRDLEVVS